MEVDDVRGTGTFVQVVDILRHHRDVVILFQGRHQFVSAVGLHRGQLFATFVVEIDDEFRVADIALDGGYVLHSMLFP